MLRQKKSRRRSFFVSSCNGLVARTLSLSQHADPRVVALSFFNTIELQSKKLATNTQQTKGSISSHTLRLKRKEKNNEN